MKIYLGIDLGSTTSKAVIIDEGKNIIGRGITNTRANYEVAADIARMEAEFNSLFTLLHQSLNHQFPGEIEWQEVLAHLANRFHFRQHKTRSDKLVAMMLSQTKQIEDQLHRDQIAGTIKKAAGIVEELVAEKFFSGKTSTSSDFFRDLFNEAYIEAVESENQTVFDELMAIYDRSITPIENQLIRFDFTELMELSLEILPDRYSNFAPRIREALGIISKITLQPEDYIGTGYGRQLLPFEKQHIKSEILCHGYGAHACFPGTRTVLDIGGQDTKAIQLDSAGRVTSFQMNDRCAAGCGRYLGYIADEMNISVSELGPLAMDSDYETNICSTCTVFAGAELREHLNLGERKENILAGLHKAIVQRAFALLARSGGVRNEFTFTGGVARNQAVTHYVGQMVRENYGELTINLHSDSIFMGALGAALFSAAR